MKKQGTYNMLPSKTHIDNDVAYESQPWILIQEGMGEGVLLGGNIQSFFLLQGTEYQPTFNHTYILAVEDDSLTGEHTLHGFSRNLESILQLPGARRNIQGIIIGRFELESQVNHADLESVMRSKNLTVPILSNVDFGHTTPIATLPIGGNVELKVSRVSSTIKVASY